jgi:hypothetical protein
MRDPEPHVEPPSPLASEKAELKPVNHRAKAHTDQTNHGTPTTRDYCRDGNCKPIKERPLG